MLDYRRSEFSEEINKKTFFEMEKDRGWASRKMLESANYLYEKQQEKNVFYPIKEDNHDATGLAAFPLPKKAKFVLICPGGGYGAICALLEGYCLAKRINEMGYAAFVMSYRVGKYASAPNPEEDIALAVKTILAHADEFNVETEDYAVIGFSAGAHLVGTFGTKEHGYEKYHLPKPKMLVLGYPVITMEDFTHHESREYLLGKNPSREMIDSYSVEKHVTPDYPSVYLWQCEGDPYVPYQNSQVMDAALTKAGVRHVYETFPYDCHGLPLNATPGDYDWIVRALSFFQA